MRNPRTRRRQPYQPPRLKRYGDLRRLTATTTKGGTSTDSSKPPTRATGPGG
ncbi:MAG TPA: lasso RiPP family leader peptide-containing protein [bacterium]